MKARLKLDRATVVVKHLRRNDAGDPRNENAAGYYDRRHGAVASEIFSLLRSGILVVLGFVCVFDAVDNVNVTLAANGFGHKFFGELWVGRFERDNLRVKLLPLGNLDVLDWVLANGACHFLERRTDVCLADNSGYARHVDVVRSQLVGVLLASFLVDFFAKRN